MGADWSQMLAALSMAGMPPFVGFWTKWSALREVVASGLMWLAVVAVLFSVVGPFYYLRVAVSVNALAVLALGCIRGRC